MIRKYRKRPVEVEAIKFDGWNWREVYQFMSDEPLMFTQDFRKEEYILIDTLEGVMKARVGDYIIKGVQGEFYPCKPDIFHKTYEEIKDRKGKVIDEELEEVAE